MAGLQEIRSKIKTVQHLQKLTHAMEMVAQSKIRKVRERMNAARPYGEKIRNVSAHMSHAHPEYKSPYLHLRANSNRVGLLLVTSDKGMCGGLNSAALRLAFRHMKAWAEHKIGLDVCAVGAKGLGFMKRANANIVSRAIGLGDTPRMQQLAAPVRVMLDAYREGRIDAVHICYTRSINIITHEPVMEQLLPLNGEKLGSPHGYWDYIYEPDPKTIVDEMLRRYIEALIYLAVAENMASEQGARMVAMKAASDNAIHVLDELKQIYHKARQTAITEEITEIIAGASAV
ncbi:MAG: F0F1 ATP synthase subunit gamma [Burkholderiales bacterium]|nr:F0F1 ATP synthase subunit gamma [Burkholderiales bacterium]